MENFVYFKPQTLKECVSLLEEHPQAALLNGGTDLIIQMREGLRVPPVVIDIKQIPDLQGIKVSPDEIFIGGAVTMSQVYDHPELRQLVPYLCDAARSVGSIQIRNRATLAGNLVNASPLADTATPLLCLDGVIHTYGPDGTRAIPLREFFVFVRKTVLQPQEIVTGITFDPRALDQAVFTKLGRRNEVDLSTVCCCVGRKGGDYKVAFGSVAPTPLRLTELEDFLRDRTLSDEVLSQAAEIARQAVSPITDVRASREYRLDMVANLLTDALSRLS